MNVTNPSTQETTETESTTLAACPSHSETSENDSSKEAEVIHEDNDDDNDDDEEEEEDEDTEDTDTNEDGDEESLETEISRIELNESKNPYSRRLVSVLLHIGFRYWDFFIQQLEAAIQLNRLDELKRFWHTYKLKNETWLAEAIHTASSRYS